MKDRTIRTVYLSIMAALIGNIIMTTSWLRGHGAGYGEGMADQVLGLNTPAKYFKGLVGNQR